MSGPTETPRFNSDVGRLIGERYSHLEEVYQDFHKYPELAHNEKKTSSILAGELRTLGFDVTTGIGGYGVVGVFRNGAGPTAMIRTEMDALPIQEETQLPYQSKTPNVMHACGHDVHMTIFLGAAYALSQLKSEWHGTLVMVGQPAEEVGEGAKAMIDAGLFEKFPKPDYALALHVSSSQPAGVLTYRKGPSLAGVDYVDVTVYGQGGHGAMPHQTVDPIVLSAQIVLGLQTLVSRETNPTDPAVVTLGEIHGGTKNNIIPDEVHLTGTTRFLNDDVRQKLRKGIQRITGNMAMAAGTPRPPKVEFKEGVPPLSNDPRLVDDLIPVFNMIAGGTNVFGSPAVAMVGDDFSYYGYKTGIPIFQFGLGSQPKDQDKKTWGRAHSSRFTPQFEPTIKTGVAAMTNAVIELQSNWK